MNKDNWVITVFNLIHHHRKFTTSELQNIYACQPFYAVYDHMNHKITIDIAEPKEEFDMILKEYVEKGYEYHEISDPPTLYCEWCGKELIGKQKRYCSKKCANEVIHFLKNETFRAKFGQTSLHEVQISKSDMLNLEMVEDLKYWLSKSASVRHCKNCGSCIPHDARPSKIFCSTACRHAYRAKERRKQKNEQSS